MGVPSSELKLEMRNADSWRYVPTWSGKPVRRTRRFSTVAGVVKMARKRRPKPQHSFSGLLGQSGMLMLGKLPSPNLSTPFTFEWGFTEQPDVDSEVLSGILSPQKAQSREGLSDALTNHKIKRVGHHHETRWREIKTLLNVLRTREFSTPRDT